PKNLPVGTFWRERPRDTIPGSYWLANVGYGRLHPDAEQWFQNKLKILTSGNKNKPVLFFCLMNCWMSWNAAKRALSYGYQKVFWYPEGTDGWGFENYPLKARYADMYIR
ncbi:MAG: PQQ-dependent catabolism-associated CXXCW motif protein, partial [Rhizobiales bacterium]|nr:PQQ-dependent catabolism-associated CXXCW motif protein [Hyphomicrobiales bacterium]